MNSDESTTERSRPTTPSDTGIPISVLAGDAVSRLDFLTVLRVSGNDALPWLQGQLTANVDDVDASTSRVAAWCSPKGRVLAIFRLLADPAGGYLVVCERWFAAVLLARLRMFILRSDVRIDDMRDELGIAGVAGMRAIPNRLAAWAETAGVDSVARVGEIAITRVPGRHPRFMMTGPHAGISSIASSCTTDGVPSAGPDAWRLADILAGVARITGGASDTFLPQMLNLDRLGAVSFEKGCYVGQEIVARTQNLGSVKRRTYVGYTASAVAGEPIVDAAQDGAPKVGVAIAPERHPGGGSATCVVLNVASANASTLRVGGPGGTPIHISLPAYMDSPNRHIQ